jgi:para-aminobenzoate synthetase component 1
MSDPRSLPVVIPLVPAPQPEDVFAVLSRRPHCLFFDSALRHPELGRYSFVAADPFEFLDRPCGTGDPLADLATVMAGMATTSVPHLPPFQGGAAGLLSYELGRSLEPVLPATADPFQVPAMAIGLYDVVVAFDHLADAAWIVSQGFPETDPDARYRRAIARGNEIRGWLERRYPTPPSRRAGRVRSAVDVRHLAPCHTVPGPPGLVSNFSAAGYRHTVARVVDYIHAGDVFQVNLSQRLLLPARDDPISLYRRLRQRNPAPFAAYFDAGDFQICSASPERFLRVLDRQVEARPIKGTRPRTTRPEADLFAAADLQQSEKDRAENIMIVDLLRNDLSKVCTPESVQVTQLCGLEQYAYVQHLVSVVRGRLREDTTAIGLLRGAFPGGSITGAPKVRAMEIIAELEATARGAYCGSLAYFGFDGTADTSILIRTITAGRGWLQAPVGGGIVSQSEPQREYEETWHKAEGMLRAIVP